MMFFTRNANNSATLRNLHTVRLNSLLSSLPHRIASDRPTSGIATDHNPAPIAILNIILQQIWGRRIDVTTRRKRNQSSGKHQEDWYELVLYTKWSAYCPFVIIPMRSGNWNQSTAISKPTAMIQRKSFIFFMLLAPRMQPQPKVKKTMEVSATARFITTRESNS